MGYAVQNTVSTKISQTWFASHTGPHRVMSAVAHLGAVLAGTGQQRPEARAEVRAGEHGVEHHAGEDEHHRQRGEERGAHRYSGSSSSGRLGQSPEHPGDADRDHRIDDDQRPVADGDPGRPCDRVGGQHHVVDHPGLAADLGDDPAGDQRDDRQRAGEQQTSVEPARLGKAPQPQPHPEREQAEQQQQACRSRP